MNAKKGAETSKRISHNYRNSTTEAALSYNLRTDHSKPKRFLGDEWFDGTAKLKNEASPQRNVTPSPRKSPKRLTPAKRRSPGGFAQKNRGASAVLPKSSKSGSHAAQEERAEDDYVSRASPDRDVWTSAEDLSLEDEASVAIELASPLKTKLELSADAGLTLDFSKSLAENVRRLKNLLKLPRSRRWVLCEFFYSDVDRQLFLSDNEFSQCLRESFPNLKTRMLTRVEWTEIKRIIGKPRRCSEAFFEEERFALEVKRQKIRDLHRGSLFSLETDLVDIPSRLPQPLVVGAGAYIRIRNPKEGIYTGVIDAVVAPDSYRVTFDRNLAPPAIVKDFEVASQMPCELVPVAYFLEKNKAVAPINIRASMANQPSVSPSRVFLADSSPLLKADPVLSSLTMNSDSRSPLLGLPNLTRVPPAASSGECSAPGDEKVGQYPLKLVVVLVKLAKLIETKRSLVAQIGELNAEAERMNLLTDRYPRAFQEKYAQLLVELERLNQQLHAYLNGVSEQSSVLLPHLSEVSVTSRPEALRKLCHSHALQIVKRSNHGLNVRSRRTLDLIVSLVGLLLQVRSLGQQNSNAFELHTLSEALADLRMQISPQNTAAFQDHVEVHLKHVHQSMLRSQQA